MYRFSPPLSIFRVIDLFNVLLEHIFLINSVYYCVINFVPVPDYYNDNV